jgi:hypothetical protein
MMKPNATSVRHQDVAELEPEALLQTVFSESASELGQNHGARRNSGDRHSNKNFAKSFPQAVLNPAPGGRFGPSGRQIVRFRNAGEGVPDSEAVAASWYRKAAGKRIFSWRILMNFSTSS